MPPDAIESPQENTMPKIVRCHKLGDASVMQLEEEPVQQPASEEVRLQVEAIGLNRAEVLFREGRYLEQPTAAARIGYEASGMVEAVGEGVDKSWIGRKVSTIPAFAMSKHGVYGEHAVVPVAAIAEYPAKFSPIEATAIWMQYLTAYGALIGLAKIAKGDFVIVSAASSSVGLAAIEILKAEGAISIATTRSGKKAQQLLEAGADHVVATEEEDFVARVKEITTGKGARVAFDPVAGPFLTLLAKAASMHGVIIEYGALSLAVTPFPLQLALGKQLTIYGYTLMQVTTDPERLSAAKKYVLDRLESGVLKPRIARVFHGLDQLADAHRYMESNEQIGKIVVTV
jgi:NADPH:quinone reductase-like Zn-dependent oxidoreductase